MERGSPVQTLVDLKVQMENALKSQTSFLSNGSSGGTTSSFLSTGASTNGSPSAVSLGGSKGLEEKDMAD